MTSSTELKDELLRQNGLSPETLSRQDREKLHETIQLGKKRVRRLKWVAGISWAILFLAYFIALPLTVFIKQQHTPESPDSPLFIALSVFGLLAFILAISFIVAVVSTFSLIVRGSSLRSRQMEDIRLSLRDLENEMKMIKQENP
ncbi:MAG: hypothetical protein JXA11_14535 [Phycisphaerae bacterium]|nr:hypothetical protein [Phycisphaerae bacterium]